MSDPALRIHQLEDDRFSRLERKVDDVSDKVDDLAGNIMEYRATREKRETPNSPAQHLWVHRQEIMIIAAILLAGWAQATGNKEAITLANEITHNLRDDGAKVVEPVRAD